MHQKILIIDSSVIVKWLSSDREENLENADRILQDTKSGKVELLTPELAKYEVGNVLLFSKNLSTEQSSISLSQFFNLPLTFIPESKTQAIETFRIAFNLHITYYDAAFLSLAKEYNAELITENIKHQGKSTDIKVTALKDY
ncbi:MAG TPA: type II toxin-antitoxin system VapC family toxin [Patescibacteria group bacterium]|nr:type II toxin-antitoxin system VapC family toxin [Patescibacteria group bacterium]